MLHVIFIITSETGQVSYPDCVEGFYPEDGEAGDAAGRALRAAGALKEGRG
jgi:hypothetical protein